MNIFEKIKNKLKCFWEDTKTLVHVKELNEQLNEEVMTQAPIEPQVAPVVVKKKPTRKKTK